MTEPQPPRDTPNTPIAPNTAPAHASGLFDKRYREVTISSIIFGLVVGAIMNAAITYAGLKIGFTIVGSAIAAVLGFGVLRGLLRKGTILETNIGQTIASAVNTPNSGVIFTVPVLYMLGYTLSPGGMDFWLITLACVAGAILGCAFIIPLRKQMIDIDRLRFPSPTGVAVILKSPGAGSAKSLVLVAGMLVSMLIYLPAGLPSIKTTARLEQLDALVEREKISRQDADRTRMIARWIEASAAPDEVLERGRALDALAQARKDEADRQTIKQLVADLEAVPVPPGVEDKLSRAAFEAARGERPWDSLRSRKVGWAAAPLPGYSDLNWRLPAEPSPDGDGLSLRVDRDRNGTPDPIMTDNMVHVGRFLGLPDEYQVIFAIAPFAIGAGFITGKAGLMVLAGGLLASLVISPLVFRMGWAPETLRADQVPGYAYAAFNRPLGIGLLLGGALMGVLFALPAIKEALKSIASAGMAKARGSRDELGMKVLVVAVLGALLLLFLAADFVGNKPVNRSDPVSRDALVGPDAPAEQPTTRYRGYTIAFASEQTLETWTSEWSTEQRDRYMDDNRLRPGLLAGLDPHLRALVIALVGAAWIWFAGVIIAQCAGMTDWSPISGMSLLTVVLVLLLAGSGAVMGAVLIGAALCVAITCASDMMGDLKTGYLVGSQPKRQQIVELIATGLGPIICMFVLTVIVTINLRTTGIPIGPGTDTVAAQADALQAIIRAIQGGQMPYALYGFGALLGALLGLGAFPGLGVLVGLSMFLPFFYIATYGIGCVLNIIVVRIKGKRWAEDWGVPFAAGLLVGEAILSLIINLIVLGTG
ncbi:MAG: OPT/YSL family transporter [Phycisphaeraceae bacterium]|nr:OPT/YSL family transporter [Phycisphaeraceae bacterium]